MGDPRDVKSARALRESEHQFRTAFEASAVGMAVVGPDGRFTHVNAALCEMSGLTEEELLGRSFNAVTHPDDVDVDKVLIKQMLAGEIDTYKVEKRYLHRRGHTCWASISVTAVRDADGRPQHFIVQLIDITAAKETVAELRDAHARLEALFEHSPAWISLRGLDGRYLDANSKLAGLLGTERERMIGQHPSQFTRSPAIPDVDSDDRMIWETRQPVYREMPIRHPDGELHTYQMVRYPVLDESSEVTAIGSFAMDITDRKRSEVERDRALSDLNEAQQIAAVGSWTWDAVSDGGEWSAEMNRLHGRAEDLPGPTSHDFFGYIVAEDRHRVAQAYRELLAGRATLDLDYRIRTADGTERVLHALGRPHPDVPGTFRGTVQDVTLKRASEREMRRVQERFRRAFDDAPVGMTVATPEGRFLQVNDAICDMLGYTREQLLAKTPKDITHPADWERRERLFGEFVEHHRDNYRVDGRLVRSDGTVIWATRHTTALRGQDGEQDRLLTHIVDVTERRRLEEELRHLADHDPLTGLLNRRGLESELERHIAHVQRYGERGALLMLDLDHFKKVNDTRGHQAGDRMLVAIAQMLQERLRVTDSIARLGGDEFAILLPEADSDTAERVAHEIVAEIQGAADLDPSWETLGVTASIGVTTFTQTVATSRTALMEADAAMYEAKDAGRNRVRVHRAGKPQAAA